MCDCHCPTRYCFLPRGHEGECLVYACAETDDPKMTPEELWLRTSDYVLAQYRNMGQNPTDRELNETIVRVYREMEFLVSGATSPTAPDNPPAPDRTSTRTR